MDQVEAVTAVEDQVEAVMLPKLDQSVPAIMPFSKCRHFLCAEALRSPFVMLWNGAQMASRVVDLMGKIALSLTVPEWATCPHVVRTLSHYWPFVIEVLYPEVPKTEELQRQPVAYQRYR